jgi:hypothetical protein
MKVVQVSAGRDYEGTVWTALFSSVEKAYEDLRNQPADTFAGVDELDVAWVGVDNGSYERVVSLDVKFTWGEPDTVVFHEWNSEKKEYETFSF